MQIVIPMSGFGERFRRAGYSIPKPLIEIEGKPIIAHVIDMFPGESNFYFICNENHLNEPSYDMAHVLKKYCPTGKIVGITPHKLGPVHAVMQIQHSLDPDAPVVVNYCDFTCYWDWTRFKNFVSLSQCSGAIPSYKGFHPHSLGTTNYAYLKEVDGWVEDIREKQPFTDDRMSEFASSGTYYFSEARAMFAAFDEILNEGLSVGGEYYVSLAYLSFLRAGKPIAVYPLQHFMQWGTPEDVDEYNMWSSAFRRLAGSEVLQPDNSNRTILPMAGMGKRFIEEGYKITKPLIPVSGRPMVMQAFNDLPTRGPAVLVMRSDMAGATEVIESLEAENPLVSAVLIDKVTEGQACTALIGLDELEKAFPDYDGPITIGACDNGVVYDIDRFDAAVEDPDVDILVWGVRGYVNARRNPEMYGWIEDQSGKIISISVKKPLSDLVNDAIVIGTFTFKRGDDFRHAMESMLQRQGLVNGEYYIDELINDAIALGLSCKIFEVDSYLCWGTPNDLKTFEYWQSCFHKWSTHPYDLSVDHRIPADSKSDLENRYRPTVPVLRATKFG